MSFGQPPSGGFGPSGGAPAGGHGQPPGGGFGPPGGGPPGGGFGPPGGGPPGGFGPPRGGFGPPGGGAPAPQIDPLSIVATVLAGFSLITCMCCGVFGIPLPIAAAVCGGISLARLNKEPDRFSPTSKALAIIGIAVAGLMIVLTILGLVLGMSGQFLEMAQQL